MRSLLTALLAASLAMAVLAITGCPKDEPKPEEKAAKPGVEIKVNGETAVQAGDQVKVQAGGEKVEIDPAAGKINIEGVGGSININTKDGKLEINAKTAEAEAEVEAEGEAAEAE